MTSRRAPKVELHRALPWPGPRRSLARRAAYALAFLWISLAAHLVLLRGSRDPRDPIAPVAFDASKATEDPVARWIDRALASVLDRGDTAPVASADVAAPPSRAETSAPVTTTPASAPASTTPPAPPPPRPERLWR